MNSTEIELLDLVDAPVFVLELNEHNRLVYVAFNQAASSLSGKPRENFLGRTAEEAYGGRLGGLAYQHHIKVMEAGVPETYEVTLPITGRYCRVRTTLAPLQDENKQFVRLIGTSTEISTEQTLREQQLDSSAQLHELEQFINLAAHDLRAPMLQIRTLTDILRDGFQDQGDGKMKIIELLDKVSNKVLSLIGDVLSHAVASNTTSEPLTEFSLDSVAEEIMVMLDPMSEHQINTGNDLVVGDRTVTQIILRNLIDNAIKHNDGNALTLKLTAQPSGTQFVRYQLEDNGKGFTDATLAFLSGGKYRMESGGFGLLGIRKLIAARGGELTVQNIDTAPGCRVNFALPGTVLHSDSR